jgi:hypothetical protein
MQFEATLVAASLLGYQKGGKYREGQIFFRCKIWGFHGGDCDDYHLLGDDTVWLVGLLRVCAYTRAYNFAL